MTRYRLERAGAHLHGLYSELLGEGLSSSTIDSGYGTTDYSRLESGQTFSAADHVIRTAELFQAGFSGLSFARFNPLYQRYAGETLPWMIFDEAVLQRFDQEINSWRSLHPDQAGATESLARHVYDWVTNPSGLGVRPAEGLPELSSDQAIRERRGDCTEFVKIFLCLLNRAGFSPYPVWVGVDEEGESVHHFTTGLDLGGQTFLLDPVYDEFNASHRSFTRITAREFLAWHWNNVALDRCDSNPAGTLAAFERALEIDPRNPHILLNRGNFYADEGNTTLARQDYQRALHMDHRFHPAHYELGNLEFDAGHYPEAIRHYRLALRGDPHDLDYQNNLSLALSHRRTRIGHSRSSSHSSNPCE